MDNTSWLKSRLFPLREDVTGEMIEAAMVWYTRRGMVERYEVEGRRYFWLPTFGHYQGNTSREAESAYPPPPTPEPVETDAAPSPEQVESRSRVGHEQVMSKSCSDADEDTDEDVDVDADTDEMHAHDSAQSGADAPSLASSLSSSDDLSLEDMVVDLFGQIRQTDHGRIREFVRVYGEDEVRFALLEAQAQGIPKWPYIRGILENRRIERQDLADLRQIDPEEESPPAHAARASPTCDFDWPAVVEQVPRSAFLDGSYPVTCEESTLVVAVRNVYAKDWLENRLYGDLQRATSNVAGRKLALKFVIGRNPVLVHT